MGRFLVSVCLVLCQRLIRYFSETFRSVVSLWSRFWLTPVDPTLVSIIRLFAGGMILYTHIVWTKGLEAFFGSNGWQSPELMKLYQAEDTLISFWYWIPEAYLWETHYVCLAILTMFFLGMFTRITSWLAFFITISYAYRAQFANFGLDQINALLAFYLALGPCGARFSIDSLFRKWWARAKGQPYVIRPSLGANLTLRMIQIHFCVIYTFAGLSKLQGELWWNGFAFWNAAANLEYQSNDLTWLAHFPWLCNLITMSTIAWEVTFWALVWIRPLRLWVLLIGVGMHIGIGAFLGMWTFGLVMTFAYLAFIPPDMVAAFPQWVAQLVADATALRSSKAKAENQLRSTTEKSVANGNIRLPKAPTI